jgi:AAA domain
MKIGKANSNSSPIIILYGSEGRGKTTLASKFPSPLFMLLERGLPRNVSVDAMDGVDTFEDVLAALREIYSARDDYQTLVIDTVDVLEHHVLDHVCATNGWKSIESPSFGKGWVAADQTWQRIISGIKAIRDARDMTIVLVGHSSIDRVEDPRAPTYTSYGLRLHKRARGLLMDAADIIGFLSEDLRVITDDTGFRERTRATAGPTRYLFLEGRPAFSAKNRYGLPEKVAIPIDFDISNLTQYWAKGGQ